MAECECCKHLLAMLPVKVPADLKRALRLAKQNVERGTIAVVDAETLPESQPFEQVQASGPWDDVVHFVFVCNACGRRFELSAETYHGAGGAWRPV